MFLPGNVLFSAFSARHSPAFDQKISFLFVWQAVDEPRLAHLRNVLIFSQQGRRPVANEISGSDLDGDLYFVSWRHNLIPKRAHPPMEYPPAIAKVLDRVSSHKLLRVLDISLLA